MEKILTPQIMGQLRHLLSALGSVLAIHGHANEAEWQLYVGLFMAGLAFVASWKAKEKQDE